MKAAWCAFLFCAAVAGCAQRAKPVAKLEFSHVQPSETGYAIAFSSDIDLDTLFDPAKDEKVVSRRLVCALEDDDDFTVGHDLSKSFRGAVEARERKHEASYQYASTGNFVASWDHARETKRLSNSELVSLLRRRPSIPCKVVMTVFLKKPYYSSTMHVPSKAILDSLQVERACSLPGRSQCR